MMNIFNETEKERNQRLNHYIIGRCFTITMASMSILSTQNLQYGKNTIYIDA